MEKWIWFFISLGCVFIMLSSTEQGSMEHMYLGLIMIVISVFVYVKKYKNKK